MNERLRRLALSYPCVPYKYNNKPLDVEQRQKVLVIGSTSGIEPTDWWYFFKMMDRVTFGLIDPVVLSFGYSLKRIDTFAIRWAMDNWLTAMLYYLDESKAKPPMLKQEREERMIGDANYLVAFTDGSCEMCSRMIKAAKKRSLKVQVFKM